MMCVCARAHVHISHNSQNEEEIQSTFVLAEIKSILLVCHYFIKLYDVMMVQLSQDLDFSNGSDGESFFFVFKSNLLQRNEATYKIQVTT